MSPITTAGRTQTNVRDISRRYARYGKSVPYNTMNPHPWSTGMKRNGELRVPERQALHCPLHPTPSLPRKLRAKLRGTPPLRPLMDDWKIPPPRTELSTPRRQRQSVIQKKNKKKEAQTRRPYRRHKQHNPTHTTSPRVLGTRTLPCCNLTNFPLRNLPSVPEAPRWALLKQ